MREEFVKPTPEPSPALTPTSSHTPTQINLSKRGEAGIVTTVVDGDTIDVEDVGRIRFADINTPEIDTEEGKAAKEYVKGLCEEQKGYPNEFNPEVWVESPLEYVDMTPTPD